MTDLLAHLGYLAVLVGTFFEGEVVMALGGFAAHQGYLDLRLVIVAGFAGSCLGDQLWFLLGRRYGRAWIDRWPALGAKVDLVTPHLARNATLFVLTFRFVYGLRTIGPLAIALAGIPPRRFVLFNALAAAAWAAITAAAGYYFGAAASALLGDLPGIEERLAAAAVLAGLLAYAVYRVRRRVSAQRCGGGPP